MVFVMPQGPISAAEVAAAEMACRSRCGILLRPMGNSHAAEMTCGRFGLWPVHGLHPHGDDVGGPAGRATRAAVRRSWIRSK